MGVLRLVSTPLRALADRLDGRTSRPAVQPVREPASTRPPTVERPELPQLLRQLRSWRPAVRAQAARRAGILGVDEAAEDLVRLAREPRREVRLAALDALLRVSPSRFVASAMQLSRGMNHTALLADLDAVVETIGAMSDGTR